MAQGEAVYSSFSNGGERAGADRPSPHDPEASVDSVDHYTPEQLPTSYHAMRSAIIEAAQASGELQPLTEAEMERRAANEGVARQLFAAEVQREEREIEGRLADQSLDKKEREKLDARLNKLRAIEKKGPTYGFLYDPAGNMGTLKHYEFGSMDLADWRVVCCDVGGEPYEARVTDACQLTRDTFGATGLVPGGATARIVVTTTSEQGTTQYVIDCYEGKSPLVVAVETPIEGGDRTVTPYLADWSRSGAATDEMDRSNPQDDLDLLQGNGGVVQAA